MAVGKQPVRDYDGEAIKRMAHCGPDTFQAVERADGGQHVGRVAALATPRTQKAVGTTLGQECVEEQMRGVAIH